MNNSLNPRVRSPYVLLVVVSIVAICGIVYELLISTAASYLLGNSVLQFSIIIGIYMSSMGIGAYLSKFIDNKLFERFLLIEIILSLIGGSSIIIIFFFFSGGGVYYLFILYGITVLIGTLVGLEIPIVIRIMEDVLNLKDNVANVLAFDYIGGLFGSIAFPLLLLPTLGIMKTSILMGALNLLSAIYLLIKTVDFKPKKKYMLGCLAALMLLVSAFIYAKPLSTYLEQSFYRDKVIASIQTIYQHIVITEYRDDIRLFIDGNLQFSSRDEYRYHEAIVHIPSSLLSNIENVLILGGGDGLAIREVLKYKKIKEITLVDLDKDLVDLFRSNEKMKELNEDSLNNEKVNIIIGDALEFLKNDKSLYDLIIVDLPDPRTPSLSKLYNTYFYQLVKKHLSKNGIMVTQASSPFFSNKAFWCVAETVKKVFPFSTEYHVNVLSFGDWGFVMGSNAILNSNRINNIKIKVPTTFLTNQNAKNAFLFDKDISKPEKIEVNTLFDPVVVQYYQAGWGRW